MTEISKDTYCYVYGKFCGSLIVYSASNPSTSKLEGFFVSSKKVLPTENRNITLVEISKKNSFEEKYQGEFIPFKND